MSTGGEVVDKDGYSDRKESYLSLLSTTKDMAHT